MRLRRLCIAALATAPLVIAAPAAAERLDGADRGGRLLTTPVTGAEEVPGPGDPDGIGTARLTVNVGQGQVCYELLVGDIAPATMAHLHEAPAGTAGPVVIGFQPPSDGSSSGCVDVGRSLAKEILADPSDYYVNIHNPEFPAGALRGQL